MLFQHPSEDTSKMLQRLKNYLKRSLKFSSKLFFEKPKKLCFFKKNK